MENNPRIFGFMNPLRSNSVPVIIILALKPGEFEGIYPDKTRVELEPITEEELKGLGSFIPCSEPLIWKDGQIAWLDWSGKVNVGVYSEILEVMKTDLLKVNGPDHHSMLSDIIEELESEIKSLSS